MHRDERSKYAPHTTLRQIGFTVGAFLLAIFSVSLIQALCALFDYDTGLVVIGAALAGWGISLAPGSRASTESPSFHDFFSPPVLAASISIVATGVLLALYLIPAGHSTGLPVITILLVLLFYCAGRGMAIASGATSHDADRRTLLLSGIAGLLISPAVIDLAYGPIALAWLMAAGLTLAAAAISFRTKWQIIPVCALLVLLAGAHAQQWNPYSLPSLSPKLLAAVHLEGAAPTMRITHWGYSLRADAVQTRDADYALRWTYSDLTAPVPVPVTQNDLTLTSSWLKEHFPLIAFPFQVKRPDSVLAITPVPGPETAFAVSSGIPGVRVLAYNRVAEKFTSALPGVYRKSDQVDISYGHIPRLLREERRSYGLILLPVTHVGRAGWIGSSLGESGLYTKDAFQSWLARLSPDGVLAVTVADDLLFIKLLLTLREIQRLDARGNEGRRAQLWAARYVGRPGKQDPYRYLLILSRDPALVTGVVQAAAAPIELLFGPGVASSQQTIFSVLQQPLPEAKVLALMTGFFSQHAGALVDLEPATAQRPFFFKVMADIQPWPKWLFAAGVFVLLGCLLFPMSGRRRLPSPESAKRFPLPMYLGCFAGFGATTGMVTAGVMERSAALAATVTWPGSMVLAGMLAGLCIGWETTSRHLKRSLWWWLHLAALLLVGLIHLVTVYWADTVSTFSDLLAGFAQLCLIVPLGVTLGAILHQGIDWQERSLRDLVPWAWVHYGLAGLIGVAAVSWISPLWGWGVAWLAMAVLVATTGGLGFWIWSPRFSQYSGRAGHEHNQHVR